MTTGVCKPYPPPIIAPMPPLQADAGSILPSIECPRQNHGRRRPGETPVVGWPVPNLCETEFPVERASSHVVLGNLEQQTLGAGTAQSVDSPCQQPACHAAAAEFRQHCQRQYLRLGRDGKDNHESDRLISDQRQGAETAGHGQDLGHRRFIPGAFETPGMHSGCDRQIERPERLQQHIVGVVAHRFDAGVPDAAGADRTSGARRYSGVGGRPVRSTTDRATSCATQQASAGPSIAE